MSISAGHGTAQVSPSDELGREEFDIFGVTTGFLEPESTAVPRLTEITLENVEPDLVSCYVWGSRQWAGGKFGPPEP